MAMYPIREQPFKKRYLLLRKYMDNVYRLFPDFMNVGAFDEFVTWDGIRVRSYRKITLALLKNQLYRTTSLFFSIVNYFS